MADSKQTSSDIRASLLLGSTEETDNYCDPCLTTGQHITAQKYCLDCNEYLCKICSDCHLRTKASRNHQLVHKNKGGKLATTIKDSNECTEKCPEHKGEVIKYFCPGHDTLGCHDCIILHHRTCDIDYIPEICAGMNDSKEYKWTLQKLDQKLKVLDEITKTAKTRNLETDTCKDNLIKEINNFRKEINDRLDQLQQAVLNEADKKKTEDKQTIQSLLDSCGALSSDIKKVRSLLLANKTMGQSGQLYITVKQAQSMLKCDTIKKAEDGLKKTSTQYKFEHNDSLIEILSTQEILGKFNLSNAMNPTKMNKSFDKLIHLEDINIRTETDEHSSLITGCAVLSYKKLVLADCNNNKLKVVDISNKTITEEKALDSNPFAIARMPEDKIAVTMPDKREILILTTASQLSIVYSAPVTGKCRGITFHQDHLYVVCVDPLCVLILDQQGNVKNKISLNTKNFSYPHYLVFSENSKLIYISDPGKDRVVSITLQGEVMAVYKHKDLKAPYGMLMLDDGSMLVCCLNYNVHHISGDMKQGETTISGLGDLYSICYNHHLHEIYIGSLMSDHLIAISPQ